MTNTTRDVTRDSHENLITLQPRLLIVPWLRDSEALGEGLVTKAAATWNSKTRLITLEVFVFQLPRDYSSNGTPVADS